MDAIGSVGSVSNVQSNWTTSNSTASSSQSQSSSSADNVFYSSPIFTLDALTGAQITLWRDTKTGEPLYQSPTRTALLYGDAQNLTTSAAGKSRKASEQQPSNDRTQSSLSIYG